MATHLKWAESSLNNDKGAIFHEKCGGNLNGALVLQPGNVYPFTLIIYYFYSSFSFKCIYMYTQNKDASYENAVAVEKRDSKEQNCQNENDGNR